MIRLIANGDLLVDGSVSANGISPAAPNAGGGSGGSVWLTAGTLKGSGIISANGGSGNGLGGGGGGGRIALYYQTNLSSGVATAFGGGGASWGGAGTIYRSGNQLSVSVVVDNGGSVGTNTSIGVSSTLTADLTVAGGASLVWPSGISFTAHNLFLGSNSVLIATGSQPVTLTVSSNATVQPGGFISADGAGFAGGQGTGAGATSTSPTYGTTGGGGGYGGRGGASAGGAAGGNPYFQGQFPTLMLDRGSGGGNANLSPPNAGGAGGGALLLNVAGTLLVDGTISANGRNGVGPNCGGGSGGNLTLTVGKLAGSGSIMANGGAGNNYGGGGGAGRIALAFGTNLFAGTLSAAGAVGGGGWGGPGTIYTRTNNSSTGQVLIDNAGHDGTTVYNFTPLIDLTIAGRAAVVTPSSFTLRNLFIAADSRMFSTNTLNPLTFTISGNATIEAGGLLGVDGAGQAGGLGTGAGRTTSSQPYGLTGGGGSYGGVGGTSVGGATGGPAYGTSLSEPNSPGSGGGNAYVTGTGGAGGGAVRLNVTGTLTINGKVSANGRDASGLNSEGPWLPPRNPRTSRGWRPGAPCRPASRGSSWSAARPTRCGIPSRP